MKVERTTAPIAYIRNAAKLTKLTKYGEYAQLKEKTRGAFLRFKKKNVDSFCWLFCFLDLCYFVIRLALFCISFNTNAIRILNTWTVEEEENARYNSTCMSNIQKTVNAWHILKWIVYYFITKLHLFCSFQLIRILLTFFLFQWKLKSHDDFMKSWFLRKFSTFHGFFKYWLAHVKAI